MQLKNVPFCGPIFKPNFGPNAIVFFHFVAPFSGPILDPMQLFFSILWPHFQAQFWTQFWGSALTPPYLFFLQSLKLDPKIGPQNGPKITSENLATNCIVSENLATNWIFFQLRPSRIRVAKPTRARKANIPHSTEFY
jgi:hypothetical protein